MRSRVVSGIGHRRGGRVCGDISGTGDGLGKSQGDGVVNVDACSPVLGDLGLLCTSGLRTDGADGCNVRGGDGSQTGGADIDVGSWKWSAQDFKIG
jgi:hypothetical protein